MKIILLGAPGSGKGTQSEFLLQNYGLVKIATGDMLRQAVAAATELGKQAKNLMQAGKLVADDIILSMVEERLLEPECDKGVVFDGFPRTVAQAQAMQDRNIDIDFIIELRVAKEILVERITGRRVHPSSGRVYHVKYSPPKVPDVDDITQEPLVQRDDDIEKTVSARVDLYEKQTEPVIKWYQSDNYLGKAKFISIDGMKKADEISSELKTIL